MKILITGANGFIGSHIAEKLVSEGADLVCLVRKESDLSKLTGIRDRITVTYGDFLHPETLSDSFKGIDTVIHAAGLLNAYDWHDFYLVNFLGTKNILRTCIESSSVKRLIYLSSQSACGPAARNDLTDEKSACKPVSHSGKSKLLAEEELIKYRERLTVNIIRPTIVYGPGDTNLLPLFKLAARGVFLVFGKFDRVVNFCFIDDLVEGVWKALQADLDTGEVLLMGGENHTIYEIRNMFSRALGMRVMKVALPELLLPPWSLLFDGLGRIFKKPYVLNMDRVKDLRQRNWGACIEKAKRTLGYAPGTRLAEGIKKTCDWYHRQGYL